MEMTADLRAVLLTAAADAALAAHAPYSRFRVGAAVMADGQMFTGCNVENASYGLTICAERVAIFAAVRAGKRRLTAVAIAFPDADDAGKIPRTPCGACRQVMAEFAPDEMPVVAEGVADTTLGALLPGAFRL